LHCFERAVAALGIRSAGYYSEEDKGTEFKIAVPVQEMKVE
jgi:hypothetical protein